MNIEVLDSHVDVQGGSIFVCRWTVRVGAITDFVAAARMDQARSAARADTAPSSR